MLHEQMYSSNQKVNSSYVGADIMSKLFASLTCVLLGQSSTCVICNLLSFFQVGFQGTYRVQYLSIMQRFGAHSQSKTVRVGFSDGTTQKVSYD